MDTINKELNESMMNWWQYNQELYQLFTNNLGKENPLQSAIQEQNNLDFSAWLSELSKQPEQLLEKQTAWWQTQVEIMQQTWASNNNNKTSDVVEAERGDRRFNDEEWQNNPWFNYIKQSYLSFGRSMLETIKDTEGLDDKVKERLEFFARQAINSLSPSNFISTNPELLKMTLETKGENLLQGMELLKKDLEKGTDILRISMTDDNAFELGKDLATTKGTVIFQNHLFELIQYSSQTEDVYKTPLLIVPPYVNKFYILDLKPQNSLVNWAVEQGHTVFMISWKNPDPSMAKLSFEDYVVDGVIKAVETIEQHTQEPQVNAMGYCIGGTLLTVAMAYQAGKRMKPRIKSATLLTTLLDFSQPGEIGVFINEPTVSALKAHNEQNGIMSGHALGTSFSMLRENSLYWNYYVNNYLKGQAPADFDLLYWNGDSTNLTASCHNFMLEELYLHNRLIEPRALSVRGIKIDLGKIKQPIYMLSTRDDHIALWQGTYKGVQFTNAPVEFVLGESGHIAGVINPPSANKYGYWHGDNKETDPQKWFDGASHEAGSWWVHWQKWVTDFEPEKVPARETSSEIMPGIYEAPGQYVKASC